MGIPDLWCILKVGTNKSLVCSVIIEPGAAGGEQNKPTACNIYIQHTLSTHTKIQNMQLSLTLDNFSIVCYVCYAIAYYTGYLRHY